MKVKALKSKLLNDTLVYGATNALYSGLPLLLMPFLVVVLSPDQYGLVDFFQSLVLMITPVIGLSTINAINRYFFDVSFDRFKKLVSTIIIFNLFGTIVTLLILSGLYFWIPGKYFLITFLAVLYFLFRQIGEILLAIYRVNKQPRNYLKIRLSSVLLDLLFLTGLYFLYDNYDWTYRVLPSVISAFVIALICLGLLFKKYNYPITFDYTLLKISIRYSAPLILHTMAAFLLNFGDRIFILYFLDEKHLGNYAVAYKVGMGVSFFYTSFNLAWVPTFFEWMKKKKYEKIKNVNKLILIIVPFLGLLTLLLGYVFLNFFPYFNNYDISFDLVILIVVSYVILSFYKFYSNYFFFYKKTFFLSKISFASALLTIIGNYFLIPKINILGAAITTLVSFSFLFLMVRIYKNKLTK